MIDWNQTIHEVQVRFKELASRTSDTLKGAALLGGAGAKTNRREGAA